jgi:hypothetical protein
MVTSFGFGNFHRSFTTFTFPPIDNLENTRWNSLRGINIGWGVGKLTPGWFGDGLDWIGILVKAFSNWTRFFPLSVCSWGREKNKTVEDASVAIWWRDCWGESRKQTDYTEMWSDPDWMNLDRSRTITLESQKERTRDQKWTNSSSEKVYWQWFDMGLSRKEKGKWYREDAKSWQKDSIGLKPKNQGSRIDRSLTIENCRDLGYREFQ